MLKKKKKYSRRQLGIFCAISCFLIVMIIFIYTFISYVVEINNLEKMEQDLNRELLELKDENEDLKIEIEKLKDPDYLARYAREHFQYSKDGEYVIKIDENDKIVVEMKENNISKYENILLVLSIFILVIILYLFIKFRIKNSKKNQYIHIKRI